MDKINVRIKVSFIKELSTGDLRKVEGNYLNFNFL